MIAIDADTADATGNEPIFDAGGQPAGRVTSGAYGYHVGMSLALAYLRPDLAAESELQVMVLGRPHRARVLAAPAFDPAGARLRA
jgi:dimethylglycine dehydrogenase